MFTDKIEPIISNGVATIRGNYLIPKRIGTVSSSWNDYEGKLYKNNLNNVLYFTYSAIIILCATEFSESMKYDEGTWVLKQKLDIIFSLRILGSTKRK